MKAERAVQTELYELLTQVTTLLLGGGDPLRLAPLIVEEMSRRYQAQISTLFRVEQEDRLVLAHGVAWLDEEKALPMHVHYDLNWNAKTIDDLTKRGVTAAVAVLNKSFKIDSYEELDKIPAHTGRWDDWVYPQGVLDKTSGFGCLYAVPLRVSNAGEPRDMVAGVFKIERRRRFPKFTELDCTNFDIIASQLSNVLQSSRSVRQSVAVSAKQVFPPKLRNRTEVRRYLKAFSRCIEVLQREEDGANPNIEVRDAVREWLKDEVPAALGWIEEISRNVQSQRGLVSRSGESAFSDLRKLVGESPSQQTTQTRRTVQHLSLVPTNEARNRTLLRAAKAGFAGLAVTSESKQAAFWNLERWLEAPEYRDYRPQIEWLIAEERWAVLLDSFHRVLPFGTGGRRGPVGIGTNRFNPSTLKSSVQGHARYLRERHPDEDLSVVVAYDVREFHDLRGVYNAKLPNPLSGITSRQFAELAVGVYAANSIRVYTLPNDKSYISTPELSFRIRQLEAQGGLNISASHNHPDDNGGKFYNAHGSQDVPPEDEALAHRVEEVEHIPVPMLSLDEIRSAKLFLDFPENIHSKYVSLNLAQSLHLEARQAKIVFTPLHGTGDTTVGEVLRSAGFKVEAVPAESTPDGAFPSVPYRAPNPEVPDSMRRATEVARRNGAHLVIACDPDADRIGVCSPTADGSFRFLTGNEIAILVTHFKLASLKQLGRLPAKPLVIKTEVTTDLLAAITNDVDGTLIGNLPVGFKYHGNVLEQLEETGQFGNFKASIKDLIVAVEESHGVLVTPELRDKDAAGAAILLAELASIQMSQGKTVADYLDDIYLKYGYHANLLTSMVMIGADGVANIQDIQERLRTRPPSTIAGWRVVESIDHQRDAEYHGRLQPKTDIAARDVLVFHLENGARVIVRPSGTEPKNKTYVEVKSRPLGTHASREELWSQKTEINSIAEKISDDFTRKMLAIIGVDLPDYALRIMGLVPLDRRIDFGIHFLPGFEAQVKRLRESVTSREYVSNWIDEHLRTYGDDARGLVADAVRAYFAKERASTGSLDPNSAMERLEHLNAMETVSRI